jgi:hypothetical protein
MTDIEQSWLKFSRKVLPKNAPEVQRQEMRRAFYAGVHLALMSLADLAAQDEERGVEGIADMHRQCGEFAERVAMGVA